jgi:hypothetical protein
MYAVRRGRTIVPIVAEADLVFAPWVAAAMKGIPTYEVTCYADIARQVDGQPLVNRLSTYIHRVGTALWTEPEEGDLGESPEVSKLRAEILALEEAMGSGTLTCIRCKRRFKEGEAGCRKHSAYYMGGTILAGRWVCCSQTDVDAPGCTAANHTAEARAWTMDPSYGTYTWVPA